MSNACYTCKQPIIVATDVFYISHPSYSSLRSDSQQSDKSNYAVDLINSDFLKYADSSKIDSLKAGPLNSFDIAIHRALFFHK
jgi:hypothetical protein